MTSSITPPDTSLLGLGTAALADTGTGAANVPTVTQADARYAAIAGPIGVSGTGRFRPEISTASGPPVAPVVGVVGDATIDRSGTVWVCTVAGSPGTWVDVSKSQIADKVDTTGSVSYTSTVTATLIPGMDDTQTYQARPHTVNHRYCVRHTVASGAFWLQTFVDGAAVDTTFHRGSPTANSAIALDITHYFTPTAGSHQVQAKILVSDVGTVQTNPGSVQNSRMVIARS